MAARILLEWSLLAGLPFSLRTSPYLFNLFAKGIQFVVGANDCICTPFSTVHYLDGFLGIGHPRVNPAIYEQRFQAACDALGFQIKHSKSAADTTVQFVRGQSWTQAIRGWPGIRDWPGNGGPFAESATGLATIQRSKNYLSN